MIPNTLDFPKWYRTRDPSGGGFKQPLWGICVDPIWFPRFLVGLVSCSSLDSFHTWGIVVHPVGFQGWLRRWRLSFFFLVNLRVSFEIREVHEIRVTGFTVGGWENPSELNESDDFRTEVNEDIVGVNHGFSIPLDIIRKFVVETKFRNHVVVYLEKWTGFKVWWIHSRVIPFEYPREIGAHPPREFLGIPRGFHSNGWIADPLVHPVGFQRNIWIRVEHGFRVLPGEVNRVVIP